MKADRPQSEAAIELARALFLRDDNYYGCAESTLVALQTLYGLPDSEDSSTAIALNGGIAYSGGVCGAVVGVAMAVGKLADLRTSDHSEAKRVARALTQQLMDEFRAEFSSTDCRDLIDYELSIPSEHDAFIESGVWRDTCMRQIEFSVGRLASLADPVVWERSVAALGL